MRLEQLKYFVRICDTGSFSRAAESLHISQPSVSQSILALERELGVVLLSRTRSGVRPTEAGQRVLELARSICGQVDEIYSAASSYRPVLRNGLSVVSTQTIISTVLAPCLIELNSEHPGEYRNKMHVLQNITTVAEQLVENDEVDLAIVPYVEYPVNTRVDFQPIMVSGIMATVRREHPLSGKDRLSFREIQRYPLALFSEKYITYKYLCARLREYGPLNIIAESFSPELTTRLTSQYDLIGFAYDLNLLKGSGEQGTVLIPIEDTLQVTIGILTRKKRYLSTSALALIGKLTEVGNRLQRELDGRYRK